MATLLAIGGLVLVSSAPVSAADEVVDTPVTSNTNGQPAGVLHTPAEVALGEPITISGTGFFKLDGTGGSAGPIFVNQPSGGTGPVNREDRVMENQVPGSTFNDARAHGVWMSDAAGSWSITIPFPTPENSSLTAETAWQVGQTQTIRILTGSLVTGDHARNPSASFSIVAADAEPTEVAPEVTAQPADVTVTAGGDATFTAAATGEPVPTVQWESRADGEAWAAVEGATDATLTVADTTTEQDGTQYRAVFTNAAGSTTTDAAMLTVEAAPDVVETPVLSGGQPAGTLVTPRTVVIGEPITISGRGWFLANGQGGSGGPIFVNQPSGGTGPVNREDRVMENQVPGSTFNDARAHGVWMSDSDGAWSITIPFPTPDNSTLTAETAWQVGQTQSVRVLTGSIVSGDLVRSVAAEFTIVGEGGPEPVAPAVTDQPADVTVDAGDDATFTAVATGEPVPTVQWQSSTDGQAWTPVAGATAPALTLTEVDAALDGTRYRAVFTNASGSATSDPATLTVTAAPTEGSVTVTAAEVEQYGHVWFDLSGFTAGAEVSVELADGAGATVVARAYTIGADGNTANPDGQTYRRLTVPRDATPAADYVVRVRDTGTDTVVAASGVITVVTATTRVFNPGDHDGGNEDLLVQRGGTWTFLAVGFTPDGTLTATAEVGGETVTLSGLGQVSEAEKAWSLDTNGDTSRDAFTRVQVPGSVAPGPWDVTFADGTHTVTRTLEIEPPQDAAVTVEASAELGGTIHVTGEGFFHPTDGGSRVAIKINDGGYSRVDATLHANTTIWAIADADENGTFAIDMPVPNGTTADDGDTLGSLPALTPGGGYTLRFLTGSLKPGDQSRTLQSTAFEVTAPAPAGPEITSQPTSFTFRGDETTVVTGLRLCAVGVTSASWESLQPGDADWSPLTTGNASTVYNSVITTVSPAGTPCEGVSRVTLNLRPQRDGVQFPSGTQFRVTLGNAEGGTTTSAPIVVTVDPDYSEAPVVTGHPVSATIEAGRAVMLTANAVGVPAPTVQWESSTDGGTTWAPIAGETDLGLVLDPVTVSMSGNRYRAVFTTAAGSATTNAATLTVTRPAAAVVVHGDGAELGGSVRVTGTNWVNQAGTGGSTIAVKWDDGAFSRIEGDTVHPNATVWQLIEADADGSFDVQVAVPTGLATGAGGSTPAMASGEHFLRFLSGSLQAGDTLRTERSQDLDITDATSASTDIAGTVSGPGGASPAGTVAYLYAGAEPESATYTGLAVEVDGSGAYEFAALEPGAYLVAVADPQARYATAWEPATVPTTGAVDVTLAPGASLAGRVTGAGGSPVEAVVYLYDAAGEASAGFATGTRADGYWALGGVPDGTYRVAVVDPTGAHQTWWSEPVTVSSATVAAVDAALVGMSTVTVAPVDTGGAPIVGACVFVYAADVVDLGAANALYGACSEGATVTVDLPAGDYKLAVFDPSGTRRTTWVGGAATVAEAQVVTVAAGADDLGSLTLPPA